VANLLFLGNRLAKIRACSFVDKKVKRWCDHHQSAQGEPTMKNTLILVSAVLNLFGFTIQASETTSTRLFCWSPRFGEGTEPNGLYSLELTTLSSGVNGELAPIQGNYSHGCWFNLNDFIFDETIPGTMNLNIPAFADANGNGFDDFFEVSQGRSATSSGVYAFDFEGTVRSVSANWSRAAGSASGTCVITLQGYGTYTHTFQILEYTGTIEYTAGADTVTSSVSFVQTGAPENMIGGSMNFQKTAANRFNQCTNAAGSWTNSVEQTLNFAQHLFTRHLPTWTTNYYGYVEFDDGDPYTSEADYWLWELSINDRNDSDHDGIPDFSDDPIAVVARRPILTLALGSTNLWLTISGDIGRTNQIQEISSLTSTNWQNVFSVKLTNDPQTVSVPFLATNRFWRVTTQ
jgi:hypothetical protein